MKAPRCSFYFDLISKRKKGFFASCLRAVLTGLSAIFALGVLLREIIHKKPYRPKAFTISIGNIVAGGTGKTPFAVFLASQLVQQYAVGILIRGYKADIEKSGKTHIFQKEAPVALVGDEAALLAQRVPEAVMFCGKNKAASARLADEKGMQVLIIDDGMQHIALDRDLEIVLLDSLNPFGYGHMLPRGLLREPISSLQRADLVVVTCRIGIDIAPSIEEVIRSHTNAPICKVRFRSDGLFDLANKPCSLVEGTKVGVVCAIAKPDQFVASIVNLGLDVVFSQFLDDHASLTAVELENIAQKAKANGATCLVCTEKDKVKLKASLTLCLPIYWLKIDIEMMTPAIWQQFSQKLLLYKA